MGNYDVAPLGNYALVESPIHALPSIIAKAEEPTLVLKVDIAREVEPISVLGENFAPTDEFIRALKVNLAIEVKVVVVPWVFCAARGKSTDAPMEKYVRTGKPILAQMENTAGEANLESVPRVTTVSTGERNVAPS